jgi:hypothetical protein
MWRKKGAAARRGGPRLIREWLAPITETAVGVIDAMALILIVIGTVEAFVAADPRTVQAAHGP